MIIKIITAGNGQVFGKSVTAYTSGISILSFFTKSHHCLVGNLYGVLRYSPPCISNQSTPTFISSFHSRKSLKDPEATMWVLFILVSLMVPQSIRDCFLKIAFSMVKSSWKYTAMCVFTQKSKLGSKDSKDLRLAFL